MNALGLGIQNYIFPDDDPTPFFEILAEDDSYMVAENGDFLIIE